MRARLIRTLSVAAVAASAMTALTGAAWAAPGPGTFTRITTPSGATIFPFNGAAGATNHLTVSGQASLDVTSVDIVCIFVSTSGVAPHTYASSVPVSGGAFSTVADLASFPTNCRLRAIPTGVDPLTAYLGSYSGPILYANTIAVSSDGPTPYAYTSIAEQGDGIGEIRDASHCGAAILATIDVPGMLVRGPGLEQCLVALPSGNLTPSGTPTASSIQVDGHNAYLPGVVHDYLRGTLALTLTQSALATTFTRAGNGDVTVTESAPLMRCSASETYPPTGASCPSLVLTGVTFTRVANIFRGAHQIRFRDTFTSTNGGAHTVAPQYQSAPTAPPTGSTGYNFPGHGSAFGVATPDQQVAGLGTKAATLLIRSDIHSVNGDPAADTVGLTWSRAPSKVQFSHTSTNVFATLYSLSVPANGKAFVGFAETEHVTTTETQGLAAVAVTEMVNTPAISAPHNRAVIHRHTTTVKGTATLGANGLPIAVVVNGHRAHLARVNATTVSYSVSFIESYGRHTITVTVVDSAQNTRSKSITVTNVAP